MRTTTHLHLHPTNGRTVRMARRHAKKVQFTYPTLSEDEATAIVLYTYEEEPRTKSLYYLLNDCLRSKERTRVRPWRDFIWLLLHALRKLPPTDPMTVYRGCPVHYSDVGLELREGYEFCWSAFTSTTTSFETMGAFLGKEDSRTFLALNINDRSGRNVCWFSPNDENEVLFPPNTSFKVTSFHDAGNGLMMINCDQIDTLDLILPMYEDTNPVWLAEAEQMMARVELQPQREDDEAQLEENELQPDDDEAPEDDEAEQNEPQDELPDDDELPEDDELRLEQNERPRTKVTCKGVINFWKGTDMRPCTFLPAKDCNGYCWLHREQLVCLPSGLCKGVMIKDGSPCTYKAKKGYNGYCGVHYTQGQ